MNHGRASVAIAVGGMLLPWAVVASLVGAPSAAAAVFVLAVGAIITGVLFWAAQRKATPVTVEVEP